MPDYTRNELNEALKDCAREPVHRPGAIQPNGCLLSTDLAIDRLFQVSANLEDILGISPADALAGDAIQLLGPQLVHRLRSRAVDEIVSPAIGEVVRLPVGSVEHRFSVRHYRSGQRAVVELELQQAEPDDGQLPSRSAWLQPVSTAGSPEQVLESLVRIVRQLSGFDRVMVYRFDEDDHGSVVAESRAPEADSYLGHHFPASDIPAQVRHLYSINPVRSIPDATAESVPLVPEVDPDDPAPLDLSPGNLRAVSPIHQSYLQNMGVGASLSIAIHDEDRLWGLLACHGLVPRPLSPSMLDDVSVLVQVAASRLMLLQANSEARYRQRIRQSRELMLIRDTGIIPTLDDLIRWYGANWLALFEASGLVLLNGDRRFCFGATPAADKLDRLTAYFACQQGQQPWYTHSLANSELAGWYEQGDPCGLLAVRLPVTRNRIGWLLFFRPGQKQTRTWAGRPEDNAERDPQGKLFLTPRHSFSAWTETVEDMSEPWLEVERLAALDLGEDLALVLFSREIDQLNTSLIDANRRLQKLAQTDTLTGLPNRRLLEDRVELSLARALRHNQSMALLFLDLDGFKKINDTLGHRAGDKMLQGVAERLQNLVRHSDAVARLGGDEFVILLDEIEAPGDAGILADKVLQVFSPPFELEGEMLTVSFSMGIAVYPAHGDSFRKLMHHADVAMYQAKSEGRNTYRFYSDLK
ncbi:bifunctional diguanylate cyclase/phosphodiesterase [Marinobacter salicampi]|uniref:bifunctional diguanylate cyclase/phosphodiesterase n=1 Tax=Marinobacter salicampi TaxID=435907 RepID=UPI00140799F0|nr:sensor domain-containing diguanylate cyclase [Marinobacter salicampi]